MVRQISFIMMTALLILAFANPSGASQSGAVPQNHGTYMKDEEYSSAYRQFSATMQEAKERLDVAEYAALEKENSKAIVEAAKMNMEESGLTEVEAYAVAYSVQQEYISEQLVHDWLRKNATGIQGFYRLRAKGVDGYMTVQEGDEKNQYAVRVQVVLTAPPHDSGELEGTGTLKNDKMVVTDMNDDEARISLTFSGETARLSTTSAFKASGFTGDGVVFDGEYVREKK